LLLPVFNVTSVGMAKPVAGSVTVRATGALTLLPARLAPPLLPLLLLDAWWNTRAICSPVVRLASGTAGSGPRAKPACKTRGKASSVRAGAPELAVQGWPRTKTRSSEGADHTKVRVSLSFKPLAPIPVFLIPSYFYNFDVNG